MIVATLLDMALTLLEMLQTWHILPIQFLLLKVFENLAFLGMNIMKNVELSK